jgi:hypothetical protein
MRPTEELRRVLAALCCQALEDCRSRGLSGFTMATIFVRDPGAPDGFVLVTNEPDALAALTEALARPNGVSINPGQEFTQ